MICVYTQTNKTRQFLKRRNTATEAKNEMTAAGEFVTATFVKTIAHLRDNSDQSRYALRENPLEAQAIKVAEEAEPKISGTRAQVPIWCFSS